MGVCQWILFSNVSFTLTFKSSLCIVPQRGYLSCILLILQCFFSLVEVWSGVFLLFLLRLSTKQALCPWYVWALLLMLSLSWHRSEPRTYSCPSLLFLPPFLFWLQSDFTSTLRMTPPLLSQTMVIIWWRR